jgi:sodium-dependent dicarboxylate transporter 2/3/5
MGGFIVAKAIERWNLHTRIALNIVARSGNNPGMIIGGFMVACAVLSMWISNTATSIMMMPIAISVAIAILGRDKIDAPFTLALLLGIAYACSIGGLGTLIGTPTNLLIQGYLNDVAGLSIDFVDWMKLGIPAVLVLLPLAWLVLTKWAFKIETAGNGAAQDVITAHRDALGAMTVPERRTLYVFAVVAGLWVLGGPLKTWDVGAMFGMNALVPFAGLTDYVVAIIGVLLCFLVPAGSGKKGETILDWKTAESIPWGVVLLFGGGMSLASALTQSGLGGWMGSELTDLANLPVILLMLVVTTVVIFSTEITSNVATAAALMPVLGAVALATGIPPELIGAPVALAASCAFMLPMATGPNAVVYATGHVSVGQMVGAGFRLNLVAIVVITGLTYFLAPIAFRSVGG